MGILLRFLIKQLSETILTCAHAFIWSGFIHVHFIQGEPRIYIWSEEWEGVFLRAKFHWLGIPHLHGEGRLNQ